MSKLKDASTRSSILKKNVLLTFAARGGSVLVNLLYVPIVINYVNSERYGIWLTMSSFISWMGLLDIGFGNGLRNKFSEALAKNDIEKQRNLLQSTIFVLFIISIILFFLAAFLKNAVEWDKVLGVPSAYKDELEQLSFIVIVLFSIQFLFQIINPINHAHQRSGLVNLTGLLGNILGLVGVFVLSKTGQPSLLLLGITIMLGNCISLIVFFFHYVLHERLDLFNTINRPQVKIIKEIFSLGFKFFVINVAYVVQYQTVNVLISKNFSSVEVTEFNIAFKLFSVCSILFLVIINPVWSSVSNAYINNDYKWISKLVRKLMLAWVGISLVILLLLLFSDQIYNIWVSDSIKVPFSFSCGAAIVVGVNCFTAIFIQILNGISKVNLQFYLSILVILAFIPLANFFSLTLNLGVFGICLAIVVSNINGLIVAPIQVKGVIKQMKLRE